MHSRKHPVFGGQAFPDPHAPESDIDWSPALVGQHGAAQVIKTPLGDPTRWGANGALTVRTAAPTPSEQLIQVFTQDPYPRNWQIVGTITASVLAWALPLADFTIWLEVTMGVGQATIVQLFDVRALIDLADPWYSPLADGSIAGGEVKSWVIAGGLLGHAVNARLVFQVPGLIPPANLPVKYAAAICPYAAGSGI